MRVHDRGDLVVLDSSGRPRALIEVKKRPGTSTEWAKQFRRNVLAHGGYSDADFLALVTPDGIYLWNTKAAADAEPRVLALPPLLQTYFARAGLRTQDVSSEAFEFLVRAWLGDVVRGAADQGLPTDFLAAIREGRLLAQSEAPV